MDILTSAGPWLYPLAATALGLLAAVARAVSVIRTAAPPSPAGPPHHAVIVWGALGAVVGLTGTVVGTARLAGGLRSVVDVDDVDVGRVLEILQEGAMVAAGPAAVGLGLLSLSLVCWLALGSLLDRRGSSSG